MKAFAASLVQGAPKSLALRRKAFAALACAAMATVLAARAQDATAPFEPKSGQEGKDVMWVPTPDAVVEKMLDVAQLAPAERLVDLGSGDGKVAIAAAKRGAIARGIEYEPRMVEYSKRMAERAGVKVDLVQGDIFASDFSDADVVTMYLLPHLNERLRPTLLAMKPGTRVVSHSFDMGAWSSDETIYAEGRAVHFWRVPARIGGEWQVRIGNGRGPTLRIEQSFQKFEGQVQWGNRAGPLRDTVLRGPIVAFTLADDAGTLHRFEGVTDHDGPMTGIVTPARGGAPRFFIATRR
ncbi:MAG TPA: class I SAM-dependent methyltransferase [Usitatibacter sp.]|nr:class I SAM-dependent methyltransferase [Usitatibacter sp.]